MVASISESSSISYLFEMETFTDNTVPVEERATVPCEYGGVRELQARNGIAHSVDEASLFVLIDSQLNTLRGNGVGVESV